MGSALLIKVRYRNAFRRFNVDVDENNHMKLDMAGLMDKIRQIFDFSDDECFIMRYVDEDGEWVNLVDDEDLHDVMRQQLKFLRIRVQMIYKSNFDRIWNEIKHSPNDDRCVLFGVTTMSCILLFSALHILDKQNHQSVKPDIQPVKPDIRPVSRGWFRYR